MTSRTVQGKIARVSSKPWNDTKTGKEITLFSFQLEGASQWFRTGTNPIPFGVGQDIKFVAKEANVERGSMQATEAAVTQAPTPSSPAPTAAASPSRAPAGTSAGATKDGYWDAKEKRDLAKDARFQTVSEPRMALSVAVEAAAVLVATAITKDAISFGSAAKAKKLGMLSAYTKEVALDLAAFIHDAPNQLRNFKVSEVTDSAESDVDAEVQE